METKFSSEIERPGFKVEHVSRETTAPIDTYRVTDLSNNKIKFAVIDSAFPGLLAGQIDIAIASLKTEREGTQIA